MTLPAWVPWLLLMACCAFCLALVGLELRRKRTQQKWQHLRAVNEDSEWTNE